MIEFTMIPKEIDDFYSMNTELSVFISKVSPFKDQRMLSYVNCRQYYLQSFFTAITYLYQINRNFETDPVTFQYLSDDAYRFLEKVNGNAPWPNEMNGLIINQGPSTHFEPSTIDNPLFMTAVADMLKQTPNHFLKIFTTDHTNTINIYTNKDLQPETIYRLIALEASMHNPENLVLQSFIEACLEYNPAKANKVLNDYLSSDNLNEEKFKQFATVIASNRNREIEDLKHSISEKRNAITRYENAIAGHAAEIREYNEKIQFIMSRTDDEEDKRKLFKYLLKHPYIKDFQPQGDSEIIFTIESPIVYYNTGPIEKYISQSFRGTMDRTIFALFLSDKYELWTRTCLAFETNSFHIRTDRFRTTNRDLLEQPHIMHYGCFGNHRNAIAESAETHDYIGAIEQISQATMNINFYDTCVVDKMIELLKRYSSRKTWRNKETCEMISTDTAIREYMQERRITNEEA